MTFAEVGQPQTRALRTATAAIAIVMPVRDSHLVSDRLHDGRAAERWPGRPVGTRVARPRRQPFGSHASTRARAASSVSGPFTTSRIRPVGSMKNWVGRA